MTAWCSGTRTWALSRRPARGWTGSQSATAHGLPRHRTGRVSAGDTVAIFGAGPVGLMAAHSAVQRGASQVSVVDKEPDRLALAAKFGATAANFADADPVEAIMDGTDGFGVDCGVEAVGYQAHDPAGQEHPEMVLDNLVEVDRPPAGSAWWGCTTHKILSATGCRR